MSRYTASETILRNSAKLLGDKIIYNTVANRVEFAFLRLQSEEGTEAFLAPSARLFSPNSLGTMSVKAIYELDGKRLISQHLQFAQLAPFKGAVTTSSFECAKLLDENSWLSSEVQ